MVSIKSLPSRKQLQPYFAEFLGTVLLVILGDGVLAQALLSDHQYGSWLSINLSWATGVALSAYLSSPSPTVNPAITIALALIRPSQSRWRNVPGTLMAQFLGAFVGAAIVYRTYASAIAAWDPAYSVPGGSILSPLNHTSAGIFATYPTDYFRNNWEAAWQEGLGASVLMFGILAISDPINKDRFAAPQFSIFLLLLAIGASLGWQTGYAINPARDFGPRLFSAIIYGREVFTVKAYYFFVPLLAPVLGCIVGAAVYDALLFKGEGSTVTDAVDKLDKRQVGELRLE